LSLSASLRRQRTFETVPDGHTCSNEDWFGFQATTFPRLTLPTINNLEGKRFMNAAQRIPEESS
jgi:hypothetical protein